MAMLQDTLIRNKNAGKTPFVYDLNIYQLEQEQEDGSFAYSGPWYIHVYEYLDGNIEEVTVPFQLTTEEYNSLIKDDPYFDEPDVWYGLQGFVFEKWEMLSDRLKMVFECLPKYKEEVLF